MSVKNRFCLEMNGWCALVAHSRLWALDQEFQPPCLSLFPAGVDLRRSLLLFASALKPWLSRRHLRRSDIPRPTYHISHHSSSLLLRSPFFVPHTSVGTRSPARRYCMKTEIEPAAEMRFPAVALAQSDACGLLQHRARPMMLLRLPGGLSRELRHLPAARARRRDDLQNLDQLMHPHERCFDSAPTASVVAKALLEMVMASSRPQRRRSRP